MADWGLLGALGNGLQQGVAGYQQERELTRKKALDDALQKRQDSQMKADMFEHGVQQGDDGSLSYRQDYLDRQKQEDQLKYAQAGLKLPTEPGAQPEVFTELLKSKQEANPFKNLLQGLEVQQKNLALKEGNAGKPDERKSALYASRMEASDKKTKELEKTFDPTSAINAASGYIPEILKPSDLKQYENAKRNFVMAQLRDESGAAISQGEFDEAYKLYFPQPGDSPEAIAQKEATRAQAIQGMRLKSGPAVGSVDVLQTPVAMGKPKGLMNKPSQGLLPQQASTGGKLSPEQRAALIQGIQQRQSAQAQGVK